ncbi:MAG TPA: CvpA family protein [Thermomicrobiaceae bacterium]|nr:CvpA family protein [Thermomicrobiaceae bacterium]
MTWLDIALALVLLFGVYGGLRRGFLRGTLDLVAIFAALLAGAVFYHGVATLLEHWVSLSRPLANLLAFAGIALAVQFLAWAVFVLPLTPLIEAARHVAFSRQLDAVLGILPGLAKGVAFAATLLLGLTVLPLGPGFDSTLARSPVAQRLLEGTTRFASGAESRVGFDLADFTSVTTSESEAPRKLPHAYTTGLSVSSADEDRMLELLNDARASDGLQPLAPDQRLQSVARAHSEEMLKLGYFAHNSPVSGSPSDRLQAAGIAFQVAGENLAYAPTVEIAHRGLMNSPGHRANILSPDFTRVGIGVIVAPNGERMFTQDFIGK